MTVNKIATIDNRKPDPEFISRVEKLLEDAKSGEVTGFVGVVMFHEGLIDYLWHDSIKLRPDSSVVGDRVIGALERLKFILMAERHGLDPFDSWETK